MEDLLNDFLTETYEAIDIVDNELLRFELTPHDKKVLDNIFRLVHSIKGTCGFIGLPRLETLAHAAEDVLGQIRDSKLMATSAIVSCILRTIDGIKFILATLDQHGVEPEGNDEPLISELNALSSSDQHKVVLPVSDTVIAIKKSNTTTIRVSVDHLDKMMSLMSELVLTRNQLGLLAKNRDDPEFTLPVSRLSQCTTELHESIMKTRMQPIHKAWSNIPRLVRDLSLELGKKINVTLEGQDTGLDRQVIELIKDPLIHMVRNSVSHGIEMPDTRRSIGKPEIGQIHLNARHESGFVVIDISDDGCGLDPERLRYKAVEMGLITENAAQQLSIQQTQQLIFHPGLSTAVVVSSVSGRGVGMDVVLSNIEKISGKIDVFSTSGIGTRFCIKIPLTLAIISALTFEVAGQRYAIPQISILELIRISADEGHRIEKINGRPVFRLRNRLLPLAFLSAILQQTNERTDYDNAYIIVTQVGNFIFGLVVDQIFDTEEMVVKPVVPALKSLSVYSGSVVLGDGQVIMIVDPNSIASKISESYPEKNNIEPRTEIVDVDNNSKALLIFKIANAVQKAIHLQQVSRLEKIRSADIEYIMGKPVIQYNGKLLQIISLDEVGHSAENSKQKLLILEDPPYMLALAVDEIIDIIEADIKTDDTNSRPGILGTSIIDQKITEIVDIKYHFIMQFKGYDSHIEQSSISYSGIPDQFHSRVQQYR